MPPPIGQQGASFNITRIIAIMGLAAAATTGYFFAVPGGSTGGMLFKESTAAGTPAATERVLYAKSTGLYMKDSAGTETSLGGGTQNGTTGGTANALTKASSANTLADTAFFEPASGRLAFGGVSASFPSIQRSSAVAQFVLADNSNYAAIQTGAITASIGDLTVTAGNLYVNGLKQAMGTGGVYISDSGADQYYFASGADYATGIDTGIKRASAKVVRVTDGSTGNGWFRNSAGRDYATADQTVDSTTLTADDTISMTLYAGQKIEFHLVYLMTPGDTLADATKFDFNGGDATMTSFIADVQVRGAGQDVAVTNSRMTALNTAVSISVNPATSYTIEVKGFAVVNAAGTFIPQFAKTADVGTGITKKLGSFLSGEDYP